MTFEQWFDKWDTTTDAEIRRLCKIAWEAGEASDSFDAGKVLGVDVPIDPENLPVPTCGACGREIPAYYSYVHAMQLPDSQGTLEVQSFCCPRADCRAVVVCMPVRIIPNDVAIPGRQGWPGLKM